MSIKVIARIVAFPHKVEELKAVLSELIEPTRQEPGCIFYDLLQNLADPTDFTFIEEWESEAVVDKHMESPHMQAIIPKVDGLLAAPPDIRRYDQLF